MKFVPYILPGLMIAVFATARAQNVRESVAVHSASAAELEISQEIEPVFLWEIFSSSFDDRSEEVFSDRLHAFNLLKWSMETRAPDSPDLPNRTSGAAENAFSTALGYSLRDTIVDSPLMVWLNDHDGFLTFLVRDSIDSVEEESVSPLKGSYGELERSWWAKLRDNRSVRYGLRPLQTNPYVFTSVAVRRHDEVLWMGHVRYYYDHLSDHRFELAMSIPVGYGFSLGAGTSYRFGRHTNEGRAGIKIFRELKSGGIAHLGFELRQRPTLLAGITFPL